MSYKSASAFDCIDTSKPFRDCAHIYETATHDNGLLLCRNHDFLFDQGYIMFLTSDGTIIISKALIEKDSTP